MTKNLEKLLTPKSKGVRVIYLSSYIPRKCGIATYTKDLTNAINLLNPHDLAEIMAATRPKECINYPWEVKYKIKQEELHIILKQLITLTNRVPILFPFSTNTVCLVVSVGNILFLL